jgi:hypothetical protein
MKKHRKEMEIEFIHEPDEERMLEAIRILLEAPTLEEEENERTPKEKGGKRDTESPVGEG